MQSTTSRKRNHHQKIKQVNPERMRSRMGPRVAARQKKEKRKHEPDGSNLLSRTEEADISTWAQAPSAAEP